jgi:hypothetical protein
MCNVNCACNLVHYTHVLELEKAPVNAFINIAILLLVCVDCVLLLVRPSNNLINISTLKVHIYVRHNHGRRICTEENPRNKPRSVSVYIFSQLVCYFS